MSLVSKFKAVGGNTFEFCKKESVFEIVKLLIRMHDFKSEILLDESLRTYLHPCPNGDNPLHNNSCQMFSLSPWNWQERKIMCNVCQDMNSKMKRRHRKKVPEEEISRLRPYNTLSPDSKKKSYKRYQSILKSKNKMIVRFQSFIKNDRKSLKFLKTHP